MPHRGLCERGSRARRIEYRINSAIVFQLVLRDRPLVGKRINLGLHLLEHVRLLLIYAPFSLQLSLRLC